MTVRPWTRIRPAGGVIPLVGCLGTGRAADLADALRGRLDVAAVTLHASGREALRTGLSTLARRSGRHEVVLPAYTCFSVPAAAVAAGLRVRLVDVDRRGRLDAEALARLPLERAAAVLVSNLFGVPEELDCVRAQAHAAGALVIDDAAQALGARDQEGPVGARGDLGLLSFGRGKPLCALGGGALAWRERPDLAPPEAPRPRRLEALARAAAWNVALAPGVFRWLAAFPPLHVGETRFDPCFGHGPIDGASLALALPALARVDSEARERVARGEALARRLHAETRFRALLPGEGVTGVAPRLAVLAPEPAARDRALGALAHLGATVMYPTPLHRIAELRPHLVGDTRFPGAEDFCARLLTLPTHRGLGPGREDELLVTLRGLA